MLELVLGRRLHFSEAYLGLKLNLMHNLAQEHLNAEYGSSLSKNQMACPILGEEMHQGGELMCQHEIYMSLDR
jgi:hypothetical protein